MHFSYDERLRELEQFNLEMRRLSGDRVHEPKARNSRP